VFTLLRRVLDLPVCVLFPGLLVPGSIVGYDDWWVLPCGAGNDHLHPLSVGEGRAHAEAAEKWGVTFQCLAGPCFNHPRADTPGEIPASEGDGCGAWLRDSAWGAVFQVVKVNQGAGRSAHGFEMSDAAVDAFRANNANCKAIRADGQV
jgi:hypothetical protein